MGEKEERDMTRRRVEGRQEVVKGEKGVRDVTRRGERDSEWRTHVAKR
jgi:hypothetical protein